MGRFLAKCHNLARTGDFQGLNRLMAHAVQRRPMLSPYAESAAAITSLNTSPDRRKAGLSTLFASKALRLITWGASSRSSQRDCMHPLSSDQALEKMSAGLMGNAQDFYKIGLRAVIEAGGLIPLVLQIERSYGGLSAEDHAAAMQALRRLEDDFDVEWNRLTELGPDAIIAKAQGLRVIEEVAQRPQWYSHMEGSWEMAELALLHVFVEQAFSKSVHLNDSRGLMADLLLDRPGRLSGEGNCFALAGCAAHLASRYGMRVALFNMELHQSLYHRGLDVVQDFTLASHLLTDVALWREQGFVGPTEQPAPLEAFIASTLVALGDESIAQNSGRRVDLVNAALKIYSEDPNSILARAVLEEDATKKERLLRAVLDINPHFVSAHHALAIHYGDTGQRGGAVSHALVAATEGFAREATIDVLSEWNRAART